MEDTDQWASQIINELFEDRKYGVNHKDDNIREDGNEVTKMTISSTQMDINQSKQLELSTLKDYITGSPVKSEDNELSFGKPLQPSNSLGDETVALLDEVSFTENVESFSNLNSFDHSCNFINKMSGFSNISKTTVDQTESLVLKHRPENLSDTFYCTVSNSSSFQNNANEINYKSIESVYYEERLRKSDKLLSSHSLSSILNKNSSLQVMKLMDRKMKLLGLDGFIRKELSGNEDEKIATSLINMYKENFMENYMTDETSVPREEDEGTFENSQIEDNAAINFGTLNNRQGFNTLQRIPSANFSDLKYDDSIDNLGKDTNSQTNNQEIIINDNTEERETKSEKELLRKMDVYLKNIEPSLQILHQESSDIAAETSKIKTMNRLESKSEVEMEQTEISKNTNVYRNNVINAIKEKHNKYSTIFQNNISFERRNQGQTFDDNDDIIINQRRIKIIETYRKACTSFEVLCVRPFAFFLAETIDFLMFVFCVLVYLIYIFYEQRKKPMARRVLKNMNLYLRSLKRVGQKVLRNFYPSNYNLIEQTGITLDKYSSTNSPKKEFHNKVIISDDAKAYLNILPSDVHCTEFNVKVTHDIDDICDKGENYLITLYKEQNATDVKICENALIDIIQRIEEIEKTYNFGEDEYDMEVIASSNIAINGLKGNNNRKPSNLGVNNKDIGRTVSGADDAKTYNFGEDEFDMEVIASSNVAINGLKGNNNWKSSNLGVNNKDIGRTASGADDAILNSTEVDILDSSVMDKHGLKKISKPKLHYLESNSNVSRIVSENSAPLYHNPERSMENRLMSTSMVANVSDFSAQTEEHAQLVELPLNNSSKNDVSEDLYHNLKVNYNSFKKINDGQKLSKSFCNQIDSHDFETRKETRILDGKNKSTFFSNNGFCIGENCSKSAVNRSLTQQSMRDQSLFTTESNGEQINNSTQEENLQVILAATSSNELNNLTELDGISANDRTELKDKNKGKIRRRMSTIFTNWRNINMMQCVIPIPKKKKYEKHFDDDKL